MNQPHYNYSADDRMQPVYCINPACRFHIPKAVSNANKGFCALCHAKLNAPAAQPPPQQAPVMQPIYQQPMQAQPIIINQPRKQTSFATGCFGICLLSCVVCGIGSALINAISGGNNKEPEPAAYTQTQPKPPTAAELAEQQRKAQEAQQNAAEVAVRGPKPVPSSWDGITPEANAYLKGSLRDYDSFELVECSPVVTYGPDKWAQRVKYRAKNGFGGTNLEENLFVIKNGQVVEVVPWYGG